MFIQATLMLCLDFTLSDRRGCILFRDFNDILTFYLNSQIVALLHENRRGVVLLVYTLSIIDALIYLGWIILIFLKVEFIGGCIIKSLASGGVYLL